MPDRQAQRMDAMITTCPECRTAFRITEEQLGAREGKVRCGKCASVFDARDGLRAEPFSSGKEGTEPDLRAGTPAEATPAADRLPGFSAADGWPRILDEAPAAASETAASRTPAPVAELSKASAPTPAPQFEDAAAEDAAAPPPRSRYRSSWMAACALLALVLMAQLAFHYRGEIALLFPEARPVLAELCSTLGCAVSLPRRADMISIESSDLQADPSNAGVMVLTATLRNRAGFPQTHPAIELTLTDTQDQPLARRILQVQDYAGRSANVETGFPGNSELAVRIYMEASSLKATGYRLYLFYP